MADLCLALGSVSRGLPLPVRFACRQACIKAAVATHPVPQDPPTSPKDQS